MKIIIIGSGGQLGSDLYEMLNGISGSEVLGLDHSQIELTDESSVHDSITRLVPDVVINCGAYVRVDDSEDNAAYAIEVNALGAGFVARASSEADAVCVYISTDYVFDGNKDSPYTEDDPAYPLNMYGISKLSGEHMVRTYCPRHYIVRSSGLYGLKGSSGKGGNFVETMITNAKGEKPISVVSDQVLAPTFTKDLASSVGELILKNDFGTYNITNGDECSWFEFARSILDIAGMDKEITPVTTSEFGAKACRPAYSVLSNKKMQQLGLTPLRSWRKALEHYISLR